MQYTYLFLLSSALSLGFSVMGADENTETYLTKIDKNSKEIHVISYLVLADKNKIVAGMHTASKNTIFNFSELRQIIKDQVTGFGYQVTEEQLKVIAEDRSVIDVDPKSSATFASFAWQEPYKLVFIFKDPQIQSTEQFLQSKANNRYKT
jgi:hypothetical protein